MNSPAINFQKLWRPVLLAAALAFLYANVLAKLSLDWWTDENYSHGLLVPFVIGFIVWSEFGALKKAVEKPSVFFGFALVLLALLLLLGGTLGAELFTRRISFVVMLAGITIYFFGARILRLLVVPFLLLLLSIPIPQIIFNKIAFPLQIWASQAAVWGVRLFEVPTIRKGNVIEILPRGATQVIALEVVEACSGIRSLMTLVTIVLVLAYFTRAKRKTNEGENNFAFLKNPDFWRALVLMLSAVPIAILTNAARVTLTGVLTYYHGKQATMSALHAASGWLVYLVALALLFALNLILKRFVRGRHESAQSAVRSPQSIEQNSELGTLGFGLWTRGFAVLLAVLLIGGVFINWFEQRGEAQIERRPLAEIPSTLGEWRQKGDAIRFDAATESVLRTTDYTMREYVSANGRIANVYVGYYATQRAGATYHSPQNCLPGAGWTMRAAEPIEIKTGDGKSFAANKFIVENGIYKEVLVYWYQGRGRFERSEYADKINTVFDSVSRRRSDGAMVRVMTSVGNSETDATGAAVDLAARTAERLDPFVPE